MYSSKEGGKKHLFALKEERQWDEIDWQYMMEESEGSNEDVLYKHPIPWRSGSKCVVYYFIF